MLNSPKIWASTFMSAATRLVLVATAAFWFAAQLEIDSIAQTRALPEYSDPEGYAVLSTLLRPNHSPKGPVLVIYPQTSSGTESDAFQSCKNIPAEFKAAAQDFQLRNKHPWKLVSRFNLPFEYEISDPRKKPADPPVLPGEQPLEVPQPPVYFVSAVGFNPTRDHAVAYFAGYGGPEAASGGYYLLVKNKYGWGVIKASPVCEWMTQEINNDVGQRRPL
jgi:hypothetical protein